MADFIPLARAALVAHERLFPGQETKDAKTLDLLALALSTVMALYRRAEESDALERLSDAAISAGRFTRGATRLEFRDRPPLRSLMVMRAELPGALEKLLRESLAARLRAISPRASAPRR
jgi:hypothetical protein